MQANMSRNEIPITCSYIFPKGCWVGDFRSKQKEEQNLFCDRLKAARKEKGLTQTEVASKVGVSQSTYAFYENGMGDPSTIVLRRLATLLEVSIDWLYDNHPEESGNFVLTSSRK